MSSTEISRDQRSTKVCDLPAAAPSAGGRPQSSPPSVLHLRVRWCPISRPSGVVGELHRPLPPTVVFCMVPLGQYPDFAAGDQNGEAQQAVIGPDLFSGEPTLEGQQGDRAVLTGTVNVTSCHDSTIVGERFHCHLGGGAVNQNSGETACGGCPSELETIHSTIPTADVPCPVHAQPSISSRTRTPAVELGVSSPEPSFACTQDVLTDRRRPGCPCQLFPQPLPTSVLRFLRSLQRQVANHRPARVVSWQVDLDQSRGGRNEERGRAEHIRSWFFRQLLFLRLPEAAQWNR